MRRIIIAAIVLALLVAAGYFYRQSTNTVGKMVVFRGRITYTRDDTPCKFFEIDKKIMVRVDCVEDEEIESSAFEGVYDRNLKQGDEVEVKGRGLNIPGYRWFEIREDGTYVKKL